MVEPDGALVLFSEATPHRADRVAPWPSGAGSDVSPCRQGKRRCVRSAHCPGTHDPRVFGDYLLSQGMKSRIDDRPEGWLVWIHNEDQVSRAAEELKAYLDHPDDPRYARSGLDRPTPRGSKEAKLDREFRKNYREVTDLWSGLRIRRRPLTMALVFASLAVFLCKTRPTARRSSKPSCSRPAISIPDRGWCNDGLAPDPRGAGLAARDPDLSSFQLPPHPVQLLGDDRGRHDDRVWPGGRFVC